jgi:hypothetical protein
MKRQGAFATSPAWLARLGVLPFLCVPLFAQTANQPQIGGGSCTSATLTGNYSFTVSGRNVNSSATLTTVSVGVGTAVFDGLSKVTLTYNSNTAKSAAALQTLVGTYTMQANCFGTVTITSGGNATFTLESYNEGRSYLLTGQDSTYAYNASGSILPATCAATDLSGAYSFNGNGFTTTSTAIAGVVDFSGLFQFDGKSVATGTWLISSGGSTKSASTTGTFALTSGCSGTMSMTDTSGNAYTLQFTMTAATGSFIMGGANPQAVFTGSGRPL